MPLTRVGDLRRATPRDAASNCGVKLVRRRLLAAAELRTSHVRDGSRRFQFATWFGRSETIVIVGHWLSLRSSAAELVGIMF